MSRIVGNRFVEVIPEPGLAKVQRVLAWNYGCIGKMLDGVRERPQDAPILCDALEDADADLEVVLRLFVKPPEWVVEHGDGEPAMSEKFKSTLAAENQSRFGEPPLFVGWRPEYTGVAFCNCRMSTPADWRQALPVFRDGHDYSQVQLRARTWMDSTAAPPRHYEVMTGSCSRCGRVMWASREEMRRQLIVEPLYDPSFQSILAAWVQTRLADAKTAEVFRKSSVAYRGVGGWSVDWQVGNYALQPAGSYKVAAHMLKRLMLKLFDVKYKFQGAQRAYKEAVPNWQNDDITDPTGMVVDSIFTGGHYMIDGEHVLFDSQRPLTFTEQDGVKYWSRAILPSDLLPATEWGQSRIRDAHQTVDISRMTRDAADRVLGRI